MYNTIANIFACVSTFGDEIPVDRTFNCYLLREKPIICTGSYVQKEKRIRSNRLAEETPTNSTVNTLVTTNTNRRLLRSLSFDTTNNNMSNSNEKVDFLLEIMKARVTASQAVVCDEAPAGPLSCGGCYVPTEAEEQPAKPSTQLTSHWLSSSSVPKGRVIIKGFDFYGNPITMKDQTITGQVEDHELPTDPFCGDCEMISTSDSEVQEELPKPSLLKSYASRPPSAMKERLIIKGFDFYGNPITKAAIQQPTSNLRNGDKQRLFLLPQKDDCSEFLETDPSSSPDDLDINPSCMAELGSCMGTSLMELSRSFRAGEESSSNGRDIVKSLRGEIRELLKSSKASEVDELMLQIKLRNELVALQRQTTEMEELYAREMTREISQKALLQAQLHFRLMQMKEDRTTVETHLAQLNSSSNSVTKQDSGSLSKTNDDMIPTPTCTFMNEPTLEEVKEEVKPSLSQTSGGVKVTRGPTIPTSIPKVSVLKNPSHELSILVSNPANPKVLLSPTMFRSPQDPPANANPGGSSQFVYFRDEFAQASE